MDLNMYDNITFIVTVIILIVIFLLFWYVIPMLNNLMVFRPYKPKQEEFDEIINQCGEKGESIFFEANDGTKISGLFFNYYRKPSWDDAIFLYSHGNGAWLGHIPSCLSVKLLSKFGSVFAYDYRQYGMSNGKISENGCYNDIMGAWNYLTEEKKIPANKIVIFSHSLGTAIGSKLVSNLIDINKKLPKGMIMWAPFSSIGDMGDHLFPGMSLLTTVKMNNLENLQKIDGLIPVLILHSRTDETIPFYQSKKLEKNSECSLIEVAGSHCELKYTKEIINKIKDMIKN